MCTVSLCSRRPRAGRAGAAPRRSHREQLLQGIQLLELLEIGGGSVAPVDSAGGHVKLPCAQRVALVRRQHAGVRAHATKRGIDDRTRLKELHDECVMREGPCIG